MNGGIPGLGIDIAKNLWRSSVIKLSGQKSNDIDLDLEKAKFFRLKHWVLLYVLA